MVLVTLLFASFVVVGFVHTVDTLLWFRENTDVVHESDLSAGMAFVLSLFVGPAVMTMGLLAIGSHVLEWAGGLPTDAGLLLGILLIVGARASLGMTTCYTCRAVRAFVSSDVDR